jgi:hypothetical protein
MDPDERGIRHGMSSEKYAQYVEQYDLNVRDFTAMMSVISAAKPKDIEKSLNSLKKVHDTALSDYRLNEADHERITSALAPLIEQMQEIYDRIKKDWEELGLNE